MEADKRYFTATFPGFAAPTSQLSDTLPCEICFPLNEAVFFHKGPLCVPALQGKPLALDLQRTNIPMTAYEIAPKLCLSQSPIKIFCLCKTLYAQCHRKLSSLQESF